MTIDIGERIDIAIVENEYKDYVPRGHLGASIIGSQCYRELWYSLHWANEGKQWTARSLRIADRGSREEFRFHVWLESVCERTLFVNPKTKKQWKAKALKGIFSGSCDGVIKYKGKWYLVEFKTHAAKYYREVVKKGVKAARPEHWYQMQMYMRMMKLNEAIYFAINKDNDEIYTEVVKLDLMASDSQLDKAKTVIEARSGLDMPRLSDSPIWWECNLCDQKGVCKGGELPHKNCRTCAFAVPKEDDIWTCTFHKKDMTTKEQWHNAESCSDYAMHDVFNEAQSKHTPVAFNLKMK